MDLNEKASQIKDAAAKMTENGRKSLEDVRNKIGNEKLKAWMTPKNVIITFLGLLLIIILGFYFSGPSYSKFNGKWYCPHNMLLDFDMSDMTMGRGSYSYNAYEEQERVKSMDKFVIIADKDGKVYINSLTLPGVQYILYRAGDFLQVEGNWLTMQCSRKPLPEKRR